MNLNTLETVSQKLEALGGMKDTKARRVLNTAPDQKANITAQQIEEGGITIEMLESLPVPVYTYQTQATIHGIVEGVHSGYDHLRYKSIVRNANGSVGIKYIGIDAQKKKYISRMVDAWYSEHKAICQVSSQSFIVARHYGSFDGTQRAEYIEAVEKATKDLQTLPLCFYGSAEVAKYAMYGRIAVYVIATIGAIYQKDVETIVEWFTGHTAEETAKHIEERKAQRAKEMEAYTAKAEADKKAWDALKAEAQAKLLDSVKDNPPKGYQGEGKYHYKLIEWTSTTEHHIKEGIITFKMGSKEMNVTAEGCKTKKYAVEKVADIFNRSPRLLWKIDTKPETKKETSQKGTAPSLIGTNEVTIRMNEAKKGIELHFYGKPSEVILQALKANGWRWSMPQKMWYNRFSPTTMQFAQSLVG